MSRFGSFRTLPYLSFPSQGLRMWQVCFNGYTSTHWNLFELVKHKIATEIKTAHIKIRCIAAS